MMQSAGLPMLIDSADCMSQASTSGGAGISLALHKEAGIARAELSHWKASADQYKALATSSKQALDTFQVGAYHEK